MKTYIILAVCLLVAGGATTFAGQPVPGTMTEGAWPATKALSALSQFTFDTDNEDWLETYVGLPGGLTYETLFPNGPALHTMSLGDPAGAIYQTVSTDVNQRAYWLGYLGAPAFLGNLDGMLLQMNIYSTGNWQTISGSNGTVGGDDGNVYARWVISWTNPTNPDEFAMYISRQPLSIDLNGFMGWTEAVIQVIEGNFLRWPNANWAGPGFADVMANYDQIGMYAFSGTDDLNDVNGGGTTWVNDGGISRLQHYGAYATSGAATWALDNVVADDGVVPTEQTSFDGLKAIYR